jgi:putative selenium metabolism hydrolase
VPGDPAGGEQARALVQIIKECEMDVIELTSHLVRIPGFSGQEGQVAEAIEEAMRQLGYREIFREKMGSVVGIVGPDHGPTRVLFDGHMDVTSVAGQWSVDPFGGEIIDSRIYGRGSNDMKGCLAAAICGVAEAAATGKLSAAVAVSATVLEETIEAISLLEVLDRLHPENVVICEPTRLRVQVGQRGRMEIMMHVQGVPAHAAHPEEGVNPILLTANALEALEELKLPSEPTFGQAILVPTDIISDPYPLISLIPGSVKVRFDRRLLVGEDEESVLKPMGDRLSRIDPKAFTLEVAAEPLVTYTGVEVKAARFLPAWRQDVDNPLVVAAQAALKHAGLNPETGIFQVCTNGSASAGMKGIPTIGLGPGSEEGCHVIDEFITVEEVRAAAKIYKNLTLRIAGGK